ncbi:hypothetical protein [Parapedomonas caeni]|jgi:hypothetical protein
MAFTINGQTLAAVGCLLSAMAIPVGNDDTQESHFIESIDGLITPQTRMTMMSRPESRIAELRSMASTPGAATRRPARRAPTSAGDIDDYP